MLKNKIRAIQHGNVILSDTETKTLIDATHRRNNAKIRHTSNMKSL